MELFLVAVMGTEGQCVENSHANTVSEIQKKYEIELASTFSHLLSLYFRLDLGLLFDTHLSELTGIECDSPSFLTFKKRLRINRASILWWLTSCVPGHLESPQVLNGCSPQHMRIIGPQITPLMFIMQCWSSLITYTRFRNLPPVYRGIVQLLCLFTYCKCVSQGRWYVNFFCLFLSSCLLTMLLFCMH